MDAGVGRMTSVHPQLQPTVLVVEDESAQREILVYNLEADGFRVFTAADAETGLLLAREEKPDVVLLDWMLPKLSGLEACRRLKAQNDTRQIAILLISARSDEMDRVRGLETGADDFICKPFSIIELMARIRVQIRRARPTVVGEALVYADITVDAECHRVFRDGREIKLGPTEYRLLCALIDKPGRVWSREQLLDKVWGRDVYVETRTVDAHVGRLRKALCAHGGADPLRTVRGAGYALG